MSSDVPGTLPSGTVTFLFTDVEGSTRLWAADKDAMSASLLVHDAILRSAIERNGGYVFTTAGDSFAAAFDWAADRERWILAGELLTASQCAYHLTGRSIDLARALARTVVHTAELDPDVHGCVLVQIGYLAILLADFPLLWAVSDLRRSPLPEYRSIGWAMTVFISTWVAPGSAAEALARVEAELGSPSQPDLLRSNAAVIARVFPLLSRATDAFFDATFEYAKALSRELAQSFARTTWATEWVLQESLADVLLGQPQVALSTLARLDDLELPFNDGHDVRALAHLALGDSEAAVAVSRCVKPVSRHVKTCPDQGLNSGGGGNRTRLPGFALMLVTARFPWSGYVSSRSRRCLSSPWKPENCVNRVSPCQNCVV